MTKESKRSQAGKFDDVKFSLEKRAAVRYTQRFFWCVHDADERKSLSLNGDHLL